MVSKPSYVFYKRKKKMNELYIYIKDQCEVKSQGYYQKYFGKDHRSQGNNEQIFLLIIIIIIIIIIIFIFCFYFLFDWLIW